MAASRTPVLRELFRPWYIRALAIGSAIPATLGLYDVCCSQFGLPKLPGLWNMTLGQVPWWGWLLIAQTVFVFALFINMRRTLITLSPVPISNDRSASNDVRTLGARVTKVQDAIAIILPKLDEHEDRLIEFEKLPGRLQSEIGERERVAELLTSLAKMSPVRETGRLLVQDIQQPIPPEEWERTKTRVSGFVGLVRSFYKGDGREIYTEGMALHYFYRRVNEREGPLPQDKEVIVYQGYLEHAVSMLNSLEDSLASRLRAVDAAAE